MTLDRKWQIAEPPPPGFRLDLGFLGSGVRGPLPALLLWNRGVRTDADVERYFSTGLNDFLDPFQLPDMEIAADRIVSAVENGETVGVFGDFDVDGLTGTAIMLRIIRTLGGKAVPYIPNRENDGHGLSNQAVDSFSDAGVSLITTVDTGSTAVEEISYAKSKGIDTVVTDHHLIETERPDAVAIVNPHVESSGETDDSDQSVDYSGAGVAFKLAQALCAATGRDFPEELLPLAALGTIADIVPLVSENRSLVREGLRVLGQTDLPGLRSLLDISRAPGASGRPTAELISFYMAPRLNAPGRMGDAEPSLQILSTDDVMEARALAERLDSENNKRRLLSEKAWEHASSQFDVNSDDPIVVVNCDGFPMGILGPLAGRLNELTGKPSVAYQLVDGFARASCRSNIVLDLHAALSNHADKFERFGGHARAAGFSIKHDLLDNLLEDLRRHAAWGVLGASPLPTMHADAEVRLTDLTVSTWNFVAAMEPFGEANGKPVLVTYGATPIDVRTVGAGGKHLRISFEADGRRIDSIGFSLGDKPLGSGKVDIIYELRSEIWRGKTRHQLGLRDIRPSKS
ncbi:MAG TPA: single-stranded-DNA-specific exonuclease RecJ [Dehalococcoidia bacterium]|nr:single-stranded-DNA-specific exonuclease RecJ [Chloroflexota bacterium]HCI86778.1 single-stranded-DNA-specific exonuclease RecJ [Dehalococcoidia bacterium]|tara:strand:- start:99 stop:1817 length:1719 start_codon:yes stop_codon:yes gene_type:complete